MPPTLAEYMYERRVDEYELALFMLEPEFVTKLLREVRPWIIRVNALRRAIYANATDSSKPAKDQWFWMEKYQAMLTQYGIPPFLPAEKEKEDARPPAAPDRPAKVPRAPARASRAERPKPDDESDLIHLDP